MASMRVEGNYSAQNPGESTTGVCLSILIVYLSSIPSIDNKYYKFSIVYSIDDPIVPNAETKQTLTAFSFELLDVTLLRKLIDRSQDTLFFRLRQLHNEFLRRFLNDDPILRHRAIPSRFARSSRRIDSCLSGSRLFK